MNFVGRIFHIFIIFSSIAIFNMQGFCQTWSKWINSDYDEILIENTKLNDSIRLLSIAKGDYPENPNYYTIYYNYSKLYYFTDQNLNIIDSLQIDTLEGYLLNTLRYITTVNQSYQFWGTALDPNSLDEQHVIIRINEDFDIENYQIVGLADRNDAMAGFAINHENHIIFFRSFFNYKIKNSYKYVFWEFDYEGNEINYVVDSLQDFVMINLFDINYLNHYVISTPNGNLHYNYMWQFQGYYPLNDSNINVYRSYGYLNDIVWLGDHFFEQKKEISSDLNVIITDPFCNIKYNNQYGVQDTLDRFPLISYINDSVYFIGGTKNFTAYPEDSWISLYKSTVAGNILFSRYFGGDGKYILNSIEATMDGGCILTGSFWDFYNYPDSSRQNDIFILKVNENGLVTNILNFSVQTKIIGVKIFPNPGDNVLTVNSKGSNLNLRLFDQSGKFILEQPFDRQVSINTSNLETGTYFYFIYQDKKQVKSGKWIKTN